MKNNNRILVIDDDQSIWKSYQSVLNKSQSESSSASVLEGLLLQGGNSNQSSNHYELSFAQQGEEGFLKLKTSLAKGKPFSVAFVDIRMPPGWNGVETARAIREIDTEVEIVIVTAFADISRSEMVEKIGLPDKLLYLRKPFDAEELSQIALQLTEKWRLSAEQHSQQQQIENLVEELKQTRNYLDSIINSMPSYLIGVSQDLTVTHWNNTAIKGIGISNQQALGSKVIDLFPSISSLGRLILTAIDENSNRQLDKVILDLNGESRMCEINIYPLEPEANAKNHPFDGNNFDRKNFDRKNFDRKNKDTEQKAISKNATKGAVIRIDDISERHKLEEIMVQSDKMLTVGGLAAGMAHEINTPLGSIIQSTQVIANRLDKTNNKNQRVAESCDLDIEKLDQYLNQRGIFQLLNGVRDGGSRTSKIVKSMLSFSHQGTVSQMLQINDTIDEALELAKSDYDLKKRYRFMNFDISRDYASELPSIKFERTKLEQVILNLIKNAAHALDAMPEGHQPKIIISTALNNEPMGNKNIVIKIKDNGPGMEEDVRKRIFDPFFTTKEVGCGTGLGLSLAYFIINRQHNGIIQVESTLGMGAEFIITLPLNDLEFNPDSVNPNNNDQCPMPNAQ